MTAGPDGAAAPEPLTPSAEALAAAAWALALFAGTRPWELGDGTPIDLRAIAETVSRGAYDLARAQTLRDQAVAVCERRTKELAEARRELDFQRERAESYKRRARRYEAAMAELPPDAWPEFAPRRLSASGAGDDGGQPMTVDERIAAAASELATAASLDDRERGIMIMVIVDGLCNEEIARQLGASRASIKLHMSRILAKTGAANREALLRAVLLRCANRTDEPRDHYILRASDVVGNCAVWWRTDAQGYACDLGLAGLYTLTEARSYQSARADNIPVHKDVAEAVAVRHVRLDQLRQGGLLDDYDRQRREDAEVGE